MFEAECKKTRQLFTPTIDELTKIMTQALEEQLKKLKIDKGIISGRFKNTQKESDEYFLNMELMKDISQRIKSLEVELKEGRVSQKFQHHETSEKKPFFLLNNSNDWTDETVIELSEFAKVDDWATFVSQNPTALPSHNPAWIEIIQNSFGHKAFLLTARSKNGKLVGGIPFVIFQSSLFGKFAVSVPYLNYGGVVSEHRNIHQKLMHELSSIREQLDLKYIEIRSIFSGLGSNVSTKKASMILELPNSDEIFEKSLTSKVRAQYKKAEENMPKFKLGKLELLEDFYSVFARNMRDLGTPVYSKNWFENILNNQEINANLIVVYVNEKPVSTGFLVNHGKIMEIPWASTIKSANKFNTNMWMYRQVLQFAIQQGCIFFDFGRSTLNAGTFKFKKQWGAEAYQHYWYSIMPEGQKKPELNPDNPKLKIFIAAWKLMPVWLTKIIGPIVIKGIP